MRPMRAYRDAASPARMIISTGMAQGINLVLRALARQSGVTCVAFEDPGYGSAQADETVRAALATGIHVTYVPVDEQGLVVSELTASGAQAVVVTPAHQSPTGVVLSPSRRHALTDWARRGGGYVIEDDYDSEFRYDKEPVGVLQGLAPDQVFLLGTASKALAPAVRLGWVLAPSPLASAVADEKQMSDRGSCTLDQLALATLLTTGRYDRHLRRMRTVYAARRTALTGAFARHAPRAQLTGLAAGFQAVAPLPAGADESSVIAAARERPSNLWRALKVHGPFKFDEIGILASLAAPLAVSKIGIFVISTFNTDYLLVQSKDVQNAIATLQSAGHRFVNTDIDLKDSKESDA